MHQLREMHDDDRREERKAQKEAPTDAGITEDSQVAHHTHHRN